MAFFLWFRTNNHECRFNPKRFLRKKLSIWKYYKIEIYSIAIMKDDTAVFELQKLKLLKAIRIEVCLVITNKNKIS